MARSSMVLQKHLTLDQFGTPTTKEETVKQKKPPNPNVIAGVTIGTVRIQKIKELAETTGHTKSEIMAFALDHFFDALAENKKVVHKKA